MSRGVLVALLLAVYVSAATEELVFDVESPTLVEAKQSLLQVAEVNGAAPTLAQLKAQNAAELTKVAEIKKAEVKAANKAEAQKVVSEQVKAQQVKADSTATEVDNQRKYLTNLKAKMDHASKSTKLMQAIMASTKQHKEKMKELNEKLQAAASAQAVLGAKTAVAAQNAEQKKQQAALDKVNAQLKELKNCKSCPGHAEKIIEMNKLVTAQQEALRKSKIDVASIVQAAKTSVQKSSAEVVKGLTAQIVDAKTKLAALEKKAIAQLKAEGAASQIDTENLASSKNDALAGAAAKAEFQAASKKYVDQKTALLKAKDDLAKVIKLNTQKKEKTAAKAAVLAAKVKGDQAVGKVAAQLKGENKALEKKKEETGTKTTDMKGLALAAAATNSLAKLAAVVGQTTSAVQDFNRMEKQNKEVKAALAAAEEKSIADQLSAKATADKKVANLASKASEMARTLTTPELESKDLIARATLLKSTTEAEKLNKDAIAALRKSADLVSKSVNTTTKIEIKRRKSKSDAKLLAFNEAQKSKNSAAKAVKLMSLEHDLKAANGAVEVANEHAVLTYGRVMKKVDEACQPQADVMGPANALLSMMGDEISNLAKLKAEKQSLKLSPQETDIMDAESAKISLEMKTTTDIVKRLEGAMATAKAAKDTIEMVRFATEIRPAESNVVEAEAAVKGANGELIAAKKVKSQIDQRVAKDAAEKWQKREKKKIGGPNVEALEKQQIKLKEEIASAQKAKNETAKITNVMKAAAVKKQDAVAKQNSVAQKIKDVEKTIKDLPKDKGGVVSPQKADKLEKLAGLEKKKEVADASVKKAQDQAKAADVFTPKLAALQKSILKYKAQVKELKENGQNPIQNQIEQVSAQLKNKDTSEKARTLLNKKIVDLTEQLIAVKTKAANARNNLDDAQAKESLTKKGQSDAQKKVAQAKSAVRDAGNNFVRDTVKYALKEKAEKTVGVEGYQKKLDKIKTSNREKAQKNEAAIKKSAQRAQAKMKKAQADLKEKQLELVSKDKKGKELQEKETIKAKAKLAAYKVKEDGKIKVQEEKNAKQKAKNDALAVQQAAILAEQKLVEKMKMEAHAQRVSKENRAKKIQSATNAQKAEVKMRQSSEMELKQAVAKMDENIKAKKGTKEYDAAVDQRPKSLQKFQADELKVKHTYADATKNARKEETAASTEVAKAREIRDKTTKKENSAKVANQNIDVERSIKVEKSKAAAEAAAEAKASAKMTEEKNKVIVKKLSVHEDQRKRDFDAAKKELKKIDGQWKSVADQRNKNTAAYAVYAAAKASQRQTVAIRQLNEAKKDLSEDQTMLATAVDPKVRGKLQLQIDKREILVNAKTSLAAKDGEAIKSEKKAKTNAAEDAVAIKLKLTEAEKKNDAASSSHENSVKSERASKDAYQEIGTKQSQAKARTAALTKKYEATSKNVKSSTSIAQFKSLSELQKEAETQLTEQKLLNAKFKVKASAISKESEKNAKLGMLTIRQSVAAALTAKAALAVAVKNDAGEVGSKAAQRKKDATEAQLAADQQATQMSDLCKKDNQIAMDAIKTAKGDTDYKAKNQAESNQKTHCKAVDNAKEVISKDGTKESARKTEDNNQYKLMKELEAKYYKQKAKYDVAQNHVKDIQTARKKAEAATTKAKAGLLLAKEVLTKTAKALPGGNLKKAAPAVKKKAEPKAVAKPAKTAKATTTTKDEAVPKSDFKSPYAGLTADLKKRPYPSVAARRRAVVLSKSAMKAKEAKALAKAVEVVPGAKKKGFSAHYWSGVTGVKSVAEAIAKISKRKPTKTESVSAINFPSTDKFWQGLDKNYQSNFVARFRGHLQVPASAKYTFTAKCDDGCIVYIDGKEVVKNDGVKDNSVKKSGSVTLSAGSSDLVVDYFSGVGKSGLVVEWEGGGQQKGPLTSKHVVQMNPYGGKSAEESLLQEGETEVTSLEF